MLNHADRPAWRDLPRRWAGRDRFVVLQKGLDGGADFLAAWAAWRCDPQRCGRLVYIAIDADPPGVNALQALPRDPDTAPLAAQLISAWPPLTPDLHELDFEDGRVELRLIVDRWRHGLSELIASVDAVLLDGRVGQLASEAEQKHLARRLARLAAPGALLTGVATDGVQAEALVDGLRAAGFEVSQRAVDDAGTPAEESGPVAVTAVFAPRFQPRRPPARLSATPASARDVVIVGAGLAGCASAAALAHHGWAVTLVDRHAQPAGEASGNVAGVFHGVVHAHDGHHARFSRAAALAATRCYRRLLDGTPAQAAIGAVGGLLRLGSSAGDVAAMRRVLDDLKLPAGFVEAVDAARASQLAGVPLTEPAWHYPGGGWMRPARLAQAWLAAAGASCRFVGGMPVAAIRRIDGRWIVLDATGRAIASATNLVLANAGGAQHLLAGLASTAIEWPWQAVRGQTSGVVLQPGSPAPRLPLSGAGYVLPALDGALVFGATAQVSDDDAVVRDGDHRENAARLQTLSPAFDAIGELPSEAFTGRTAWRCVSSDRLPLIGAVPAAWTGEAPVGSWDQPRFVPREAGLYLFTALGSRGITWSPLGAEVLASMMGGAPVPLAASLVDAVDPARFLTRAHRRRASTDHHDAGD